MAFLGQVDHMHLKCEHIREKKFEQSLALRHVGTATFCCYCCCYCCCHCPAAAAVAAVAAATTFFVYTFARTPGNASDLQLSWSHGSCCRDSDVGKSSWAPRSEETLPARQHLLSGRLDTGKGSGSLDPAPVQAAGPSRVSRTTCAAPRMSEALLRKSSSRSKACSCGLAPSRRLKFAIP